jgi:hypothetical protein
MSENLLQEFNEFKYVVEELSDNGQPKKFKLKGVYQAADTPNGNKRVYPRSVLESAVKSVVEMVNDKRMLGELDHPSDAKIHLDKVSHVVTKLEMNPEGQVYGEAEVLPTASGKILESLLRSGVKLGISSRGFGSTKPNDKGLDEVQGDYKLVTFDIVSDPSTPGAFPQAVYEQKEEKKEEKKVKDAVIDLETLVDESLEETVELDKEPKEFVCTDGKGARFYIVEGDKDSYGFFNFHIAHDYHLLIRNEDSEERVGLNIENIQLLENIYGDKVTKKINKKLDELGYDPQTMTLKKEE